MALPSPSFLLGLLVLVYFSTFVFFAILRIVTGISIQRIGPSGLRRIHFTLREGVRVDIRGLGLSIHRPTFAQPTWFSVILSELQVTIDLKTLGGKARKRSSLDKKINGPAHEPNGSADVESNTSSGDEKADNSGACVQRSRTWERLTELKEKIKRLHRKIQWIRMVDLVATTSTCVVLDVGSIQVGNFTMTVDTRRATVDRSRLFQHKKASPGSQQPAQWLLVVRGLLFTPEGKDSMEILDYFTLNVHGLLYKELEGLRDASVAVKLGRLNLPYDDIKACVDRATRQRMVYRRRGTDSSESNIPVTDTLGELVVPKSREEAIIQTVSDSKEFISSILRGIQEIQFAVSFFGFSKDIRVVEASGLPIYLNMSMKEVGFDLLRMDPKSPAHRMYFSPKDIAHQALIAVNSISVGIDDGHAHPERLMYIPMVTATLRTTLPSKTIQPSKGKDARERNTNMLFANLVCTSPSIDLDPSHLPLVLQLLKSRDNSDLSERKPHTERHLISRLLPKASIKVSVHEPVVRVSLPPMNPKSKGTDDFDLLISSMTSIAIEVESSHSADGDLHYSLGSHLRVTSHQLYYQTASAEKHNLLMTEILELRTQVSASPEIAVAAIGSFQTFSIYLARPEICEGLRQIVEQLRSGALFERDRTHRSAHKPSFLRTLPPWLVNFQLHGSDFNFEVAGVDAEVSPQARGFALHLESWTADYKAHKDETPEPVSRRRSSIRRMSKTEGLLNHSPSASPSRKPSSVADGRRLAVHVHEFEGFVIESDDSWEPEPFVSLPRFEVAFTTSTDHQGPVFHVNSHARSLYIHYSLYRHFAVGMATMVLRRTFVNPLTKQTGVDKHPPSGDHLAVPGAANRDSSRGSAAHEITTVDFKAAFIQVKATMPADPPLMIQVYGLEAGRHRWTTPFLRARLTRLYAQTLRIKRVWSRIVSVKHVRLDLRESRRKNGAVTVEERSIDIAAEAIRVAVPYQLVVHKIFDNIANVTKTVQQLHHRFKTDSNEYILFKEPEGPKHVPRVTVRTQVLLFEIEDDSFEWKLGVIYRLGLIEQKQRLARAEAFRLKVKRITEDEQRRGSSRFRTRSEHAHTHDRSKSKAGKHKKHRSKSAEGSPRRRSLSRSRSEDHGKLRYDAEGVCGLSDTVRVTTDQAWEKLKNLDSQSWKRRIDRGLSLQNQAVNDIRSLFWGLDELPDDVEQKEKILALAQRPPLASYCISDLSIVIDKPSFPIREYPDFMYKVGKGMPRDMKYSLLIPMNLHISMGEARFALRDYPLPLLHVPAIRSGQSPRLPSLSLKTDFIIAEEFRDTESERHVNVVVVPPENLASGEQSPGFTVDVRRTVSPVKTYSNMSIDINTSYATRLTWGTSYQPAIQDMMQVVEGFTKPAIDPSDRVGFWDKIRLSFHSRVNIAWKGDGDLHLVIKGSRDPYVVTGHGAGFVMCWRNDVRWSIAQDDDPRKFMIVDSGDYVLAIPDFNHFAREATDSSKLKGGAASSTLSYKQGPLFKKVIMKLSGNVRWMSGLMFQRNVDGGGRSFDFKPHYDVILKNPRFAKAPPGQNYDAFRGFRSHHIHMSVAVAAPHDRDWSVTNLKPSSNYNSVHLSPRFFTHFFSWWSMFSGTMSLPIRQGPLWGDTEKSSKKFGRHLATIKYNLLLSPLFISHIYKHKDVEDYQQDVVSATGLKLRLDSFTLDLHQRREEFPTQVQHVHSKQQGKTSGMRINQCQLDFISADLRAVSASITGSGSDDIERATDETLASYRQNTLPVDLSKFTVPDNDFSWVDMDDFVELDWILPAESNPETKILPLGFAPRFTYYRQTDHQPDSIHGDTARSSPFGNELTHYCVMSRRIDPRHVQCDLIQERLDKIADQTTSNHRAVLEQELRTVRDASGGSVPRDRLEALRQHGDALDRKEEFLESMLKTLRFELEDVDPKAVPGRSPNQANSGLHVSDSPNHAIEGMDSTPLVGYANDFNNRFVVHNAQIKWNNPSRNIILRYIHQVSQRRGFIYYMSRRAVKFILDILQEQSKSKATSTSVSNDNPSGPTSPLSPEQEDELSIQDRIDELLKDGKKFVDANDLEASEGDKNSTVNDISDDIAHDFTAQNTYSVRLIAPQIQLQSEKNVKSAVLVTAKGIQLKVIQIMDKDRVLDDVSGLVQRRFSAATDSVQVFVTNSKTFSTEYLDMYSGNQYGTSATSSWPPWVPFEVMFDFQLNPYGFSRVVQRTSASLRYDKYNALRLKYNDDISGGDPSRTHSQENTEDRIDHLWVEFPEVKAICDSSQYYAMYIIVLDLLLYSEPLEKTRSERLEKIMLASDFSDLTGAPEMVIMLQERIRQLEEIKMHFQINEQYLDRRGWKDRIAMDRDLVSCEDELFFMMKAITTSQRKAEERTQQTESSGIMHWSLSASEIAWHLVRDQGESLLEFQLKHANYDRTDNNDGSNNNCMEIRRINGFNLLADALYPEIIAPYVDSTRGIAENRDAPMLRVNWLMLEAIAGIPVVDRFEINLVPLKIQLERDIGKKLFEYIFPGVGGNAFEGGNFSPFMVKHMLPPQEEEEETDINEAQGTQTPRMESGRPASSNTTGTGTGAGELALRLKPTLTLPDNKHKKNGRPRLAAQQSGPDEAAHHFRIFQHSNKSRDGKRNYGTLRNDESTDSLGIVGTPRPPLSDRSVSNLGSVNGNSEVDKSKRFTLHRPASGDKKNTKDVRSDDLTQMMNRASNYMTLAYVKIPSMVLCLSYKGKGQRNIEDVHDLVFRMPTIEYRNKTWSNLDLALQLKKDLIKILLSHTGAILGNKLTHHRTSKQQQSRLREVANSSTILTSSADVSHAASERSSMIDKSPLEDQSMFPRESLNSEQPSVLSRTQSYASMTPNGMLKAGASEGPSLNDSATSLDKDTSRHRGSSLGRHFTSLGHRMRQNDSNADDSEDSQVNGTKRKSTFKDKILRSLPHS